MKSTLLIHHCKSFLFNIFALSLFTPSILAQVVTYPLRTADMSRKAPQILHDKMTASPLVRGPGLAQDTRFFAFSAHQMESSLTPVEDDYFEFTVTSKPGYSFTPSYIEYALFSEYSFSGWEGPRDFQLQYSVDGFTTPGIVLATHLNLPYGSRGATTLQTKFSTDLSSIGTHFCTISFRLYVYHRQGPQRTAFAGLGNGFPGESTGQTFVSWAGEGSDVKIYGSVGLGQGSTDIRLSSTESTDPLEPGQSMTYNVTVTNDGPETTRDLAVDVPLTLPQGVTLSSLTMDQGQLWHGSIWVLGELAVGASAHLAATVQAATTAPAGNDIIRFEPALKCLYQMPSNTVNDAAPQTTSIPLDLQVTMTESTGPVIAGSGNGNLTYVVTATNIGNSGATGLSIENTLQLPSGASIASITPTPGTGFDNSTWSIGSLAKGQSKTLTVRVTAGRSTPDQALISNTARILNCDQVLYNTSDDEATLQTRVSRRVDLVVTVTDTDPVIAGASTPLVYNVTVTNLGPSDASGVAVNGTPNLPYGVILDSTLFPSGTSWDGTTWTLGNLEGNGQAQTASYSLLVAPDATAGQGVVSFVANGLTSNETRIQTSNDTDTETTDIEQIVKVTIGGADSIDPVIAGSGIGNLTHRFRITNEGPSAATGIQAILEFRLPPQAIIESVQSEVTDSYNLGNWSLGGSLGVGQSRDLLITLTIPSSTQPSSRANPVQISAFIWSVDQPRIDITGESTSIQTMVVRKAVAEVFIIDNPDPVGACGTENLVYTIGVRNVGPSDIDSVRLAPRLQKIPAGVLNDPATGFGLLNRFVFLTVPAGGTAESTAVLTVLPEAPQGTDLIVVSVGIENSLDLLDPDSILFATEKTSIAKTDLTPPVLVGPEDITVSADLGAVMAVVSYETPVGTDGCDVTTEQTEGFPSGSEFPLGTTRNTFVASDASGNTTEYSFLVTVVDEELPVIHGPGDLSVFTDPGQCGAVVIYSIQASDNDSGVTLETLHNSGLQSGNFFPVGTTVLSYRATDRSGNQSETNFSITVTDRELPSIRLADLNVNLDDQGQVTIHALQLDAGTSDNCGIESISLSQSTFNCSNLGPNSIQVTVQDIHGNLASAEAIVTVQDTKPPIITLNGDATVYLECGQDYLEPGAMASDICVGDLSASLQIDASSIDSHTPGSYAVTYNVTDAAGNPAIEVIRTVIVQDTTAPIITLEGDAVVYVECSEDYLEPGATASDNCAGDLSGYLQIDASSIDSHTPGSYAVTYNVTDAAGNPAIEVVRTVIVQDTTAPIITLFAKATLILECGENYIEYGASGWDGCTGDLSSSIQIDSSSVNSHVPGKYVVRYNVVDAAGNSAVEVLRTVIVQDTLPPQLYGPTEIIVDATSLSGTIVDYIVTALDQCDTNPILNCIPSPGSLFPVGTTTVLCIAQDYHGNHNQHEFIVHVRSAQEMNQNLIDAILDMNISPDMQDALVGKLNEIGIKIEEGRLNSAINQIRAFMKQVRSQTGKTLTQDQVNQLLKGASNLIQSLEPDQSGGSGGGIYGDVVLPPMEIRFLPQTNELQLNWGGGQLQSRANLHSPWSDVPEASSPWRVSANGKTMFFRIQSQSME